MAFTARNGRRVSNPTLAKWLRQVEKGQRSKIEVERTELGDLTSRGKSFDRLVAIHLDKKLVEHLR